MALARRFHTETIRVPAAAAGQNVVWQAPGECYVKAVRAYRSGGTSATVNAVVDPADGSANRNVLATAVTAGNAAFAKQAPATVAAGKMLADDVLVVDLVTAVGTPLVVVQVDIALAETVRDL